VFGVCKARYATPSLSYSSLRASDRGPSKEASQDPQESQGGSNPSSKVKEKGPSIA